MDIVIKIIQLILSLSVLVIIHEFGHFAAAKIFKTKVEKFYLFFNPGFSLFKFKYGETEYGVGWLPLGGYVKIAGMIDESMDKEQMAKDPEPWEFRSKPAWQRLIIMLGGVIMNVVLAALIYIVMMATYGEQYLPNSAVKYGIQVDSLGQSIGLRNGDKILSLDNESIDEFSKIPVKILLDEINTIQVERNGNHLEIPITGEFKAALIAEGKPGLLLPRMPVRIGEITEGSNAEKAGLEKGDWLRAINGKEVLFVDQFDIFKDSVAANNGREVAVTIMRQKELMDVNIQVQKDSLIGIYTAVDLSMDFELKSHKYTIIEAFPAGINKAIEQIESYLKQLKMIFNPEMEAYKSVGGFGMIASIFPATWDWIRFWELTAFLSIMLAVLNILPIPALDGGHVMFLMYEIIARRKPSDKFLEYAQYVGMILLLALLVFANGNDIYKYFFK